MRVAPVNDTLSVGNITIEQQGIGVAGSLSPAYANSSYDGLFVRDFQQPPSSLPFTGVLLHIMPFDLDWNLACVSGHQQQSGGSLRSNLLFRSNHKKMQQ